MFQRQSRLTRPEIEQIMKGGRTIHSRLFSVRYQKAPNKASKFAFVMSKKEEKSAPRRNNAKRRLRAAVRTLLPPTIPIFCMIFIKKTVSKAAFGDIVLELKKVLPDFFIS